MIKKVLAIIFLMSIVVFLFTMWQEQSEVFYQVQGIVWIIVGTWLSIISLKK